MAVQDKKLALTRQFLGYIHPLKSITNALDQKECWIEQMKYLVQDFKILLNLSFNEFWSTVVFNKQATMGLCTFLQEAAPPHLMDQLPHDDDVLMIYNEIDHFAYKLFKRLTTSSENKKNYMLPNSMWSLLCNNNIVSIPMLFDICSIYGQSHKKELSTIFKELFTSQKLYKENLKTFIQFTIKGLSQFQDKIEIDIEYSHQKYQIKKTGIEIEETNLCMIEDIINFLLDTSYSITNFLEIYPMASSCFYQEKLHLKIASFYHSIKPLIYMKVISMNKLEKFQDKLHASRLLLVKSVKLCLNHIFNQITNMKSENEVEEYLEVVGDLLVYNEFVNDYNVVYNLTNDIKKCQKIYREIDSKRYDYLFKSLELINKPYTELEEKELLEQQREQQISSTNIENATFLSIINNVKDLLPHLGDGFIRKCLEYYDMDSEKVISMILENCLPPELTQYDFNLPLLSEYEDNATGYDLSIKKNKELEKLKAVLDDKSFRNEMRPFYNKYNLTEITCAEFESYYNNDQPDEVEYIKPLPADENEKRRPDVMPRVLIGKKLATKFVEEELSEDEPQQVLKFQPFCENPEEVRKRLARKYAAKQSNRSKQNKPKVASSSGTTSGSNIELNRQRKNENKAFSGNHNRRNAARNKQQKGMF